MLPLLPHDKLGHFFWGAVAATIAFVLSAMVGLGPVSAANQAMLCATIVGLGKEVLDAAINARATGNTRSGPRSVDPIDFLATAAGGIPYLIAARSHDLIQAVNA